MKVTLHSATAVKPTNCDISKVLLLVRLPVRAIVLVALNRIVSGTAVPVAVAAAEIVIDVASNAVTVVLPGIPVPLMAIPTTTPAVELTFAIVVNPVVTSPVGLRTVWVIKLPPVATVRFPEMVTALAATPSNVSTPLTPCPTVRSLMVTA